MKAFLDLANGLTGIGADLLSDIFGKETNLQPVPGAILYCNLGAVEHSGVYLGNSEIIHLNGSGIIEKVSPDEFIHGPEGSNIYVGCRDDAPVGNNEIAKRALRFEKEVSVKDYNVILDNCHQFTTGCITNEIENASTFFWMLKYTCEKHLLINNWRKWDYTKKNQGLDLAAEENLVKIQTMIAVKKKLQDTLLNDSWSALRKSFEHSTKRPEFGYFGYESRLRSWEEKDSKLTKISDNISDQLDSVGIEIQHLEQIENNILEALNN